MFFPICICIAVLLLGVDLICYGAMLLLTDNPPPDPPPEPPRDERREYCSLEGLDRIIVDVSPRPVPLSGDLANRTNSGQPIRTQEK